MSHVHITVTGKHTAEWKRDLMDFAADTIHGNTSTPLKNVYVYIHEMEPENVRKTAPIVRIDRTTISDRTQAAKNAIMTALTDKLAEITGENKMEISILINDIPLACGMLGGSPGRTTATGDGDGRAFRTDKYHIRDLVLAAAGVPYFLDKFRIDNSPAGDYNFRNKKRRLPRK